jgi:MFS family permease
MLAGSKACARPRKIVRRAEEGIPIGEYRDRAARGRPPDPTAPSLWRREGFPGRTAPWILLALATLSQAGASLSQQGVAVLAVFFRADFHLSFSAMGGLVSATSLGMVAGLTVSGLLVDRVGPRWLLLGGGAWALAAATAVAAARSYEPLVLALFVMGIGLGAMPSAGTRAVFDAFRGRARGLVMGIRQTGVPIGAAVAAVAIPLEVAGLGTGGMFIAIGVLVLVTAWAFSGAVPPFEAPTGSLAKPGGLGWLRPARGPMLVGMMLVAAQYSVLTFTITDLHTRHGWPLAAAGLGLALVQVGGGVGRIGLGWWSDRLGQRRAPVIVFAAVVGALSAVMFGWAPAGTPAVLLAALMIPLGVGAVGWNALVLTWAGERVPASGAGQAMSWTGSAVFLGSSVYPPLFGWLLDRTGHYSLAFSTLGLWILMAAGLVLWVERRGAGRGRRSRAA